MKKKPEIKDKEYKIFKVQETKNEFPICVKDLNKQVMFTLFCKELLTTVVGKNIDLDKCAQIIKELTEHNDKKLDIGMRIVGGDKSEGTAEYIDSLYDTFTKPGTNVIITLLSNDGGDLPHPPAVDIDCYGGISRYVDDIF